jgi:hypothetical protein
MNQQLRDWAKQALEMLNDNHHLVADNEKHRYVMMHLDVIKRGKALLEQPEPVQEPVAWVYSRKGNEYSFSWARWDTEGRKGWDEMPLYAAPPIAATPLAQPAAWVGLTDEERRKLFDPLHDAPFEFAKRIEAKLREKNGGAA